MARYTGPRVRVSRRIGFNVFENRKGDKALQDRPYPPGENGRKRARETDYGTQLKEKQKVRYMYGVLEKQFRLILTSKRHIIFWALYSKNLENIRKLKIVMKKQLRLNLIMVMYIIILDNYYTKEENII